MKKFFALLAALGVIIFSANISHAAKQPEPVLLADITAEEFFTHMGYEVDCSYWEKASGGRQLFFAMIPEEPLIISKDLANVEVYAEKRKGKIVEVVLYFKAAGDKSATASILARAVKSLDENIFTENRAAIEKRISDFLDAPQTTAEIFTVADHYVLQKEEEGRAMLAIHITPAQKNS